MGEVYLAEHPRLPRHDALKVLPADVSADSDFRSRFNLEADLAATLFHPHIVGVHDRGDFEGQLWIAMDYVEGTDAAQLMKAHYPARMPIEDVCAIVTAVADALDYAHKRGLLHRDVKPANILLAEPEDGKRRILLADFGIARPLADISGLTATNFTVGTLTYAAPEQLMGGDIDGRADQYALAATAFHLLRVRHHISIPTRSPSSANTSMQHRQSSATGAPSWRTSIRCCQRHWPRTLPTGSTDAATSPPSSVSGPPSMRKVIVALKLVPRSPRMPRGLRRRCRS
jgi:serine/threonine-protein kinase